MKVVVLTGATRGIGAATATRLAKAGAGLTLVGRDTAALDRISNVIRQFTTIECVTVGRDVAEGGAADEITFKTLDQFGQIDTLINNAAVVTPLGSVASSDPQTWRRSFDVNFFAPLDLITATLPSLRLTEGRIINVCSELAENPRHGLGAYCTSKAALLHLTRVLSLEEESVTSLAYAPGLTATDMTELLVTQGPGKLSDQTAERLRTLHDTQRMGSPDAKAADLAWLALHASKDMNGRMIDHTEMVQHTGG